MRHVVSATYIIKSINFYVKKYCLFVYTTIVFFSCTQDPTISLPIPPTDLNGALISPSQIDLNWVDRSTNESGFKIERKTNSTQYSVVGTVNSDLTRYSDRQVLNNTTYTYRIYSYNSVGNSPTYSNEISITTVDLKSGLLAFFPFTGNIVDSSENNVSSNLRGLVTLTNDRFGKNSSAYLFSCSGFNADSRIAGSLGTPLGNNFSIAFWAKRNTSQPTGGSFDDNEWIFMSGIGDNKRVYIGIPRGSNVLVYGTTSTPVSTNYGIDDKWTHYTLTYSSGEIRIYVNGRQISTLQRSINIDNTLYVIGNIEEFYNREGFNGSIDDVRIYNRVLPLNVIEYLSKN